MSRLRSLLWYWLPVVAWMAAIMALSSQSSLPLRENPATGEVIRTTYTLAKLAHVVEYGGLALLLMRALTQSGGGLALTFRVAAVWAVIAATAFGACDELRQSLVPHREPRATDVLIDGASACAAVLLLGGLRSARKLVAPERRAAQTVPD